MSKLAEEDMKNIVFFLVGLAEKERERERGKAFIYNYFIAKIISQFFFVIILAYHIVSD